jgi:ABC-type uncharacterized transport system substrate-binding protein
MPFEFPGATNRLRKIHMANPATILAVAIGDPAKSRTIADMTNVTGLRPYIFGLITYLSQQPVPKSKPQRNYTIGTDYVIDYRECAIDSLSTIFTGTPNVIFCMSTPVVRHAETITSKSNIPIVGIVSDPTREGFDTSKNVCGVNAQRIQHGRDYYDNFLKTVSFAGLQQKVYVLHLPGNTASEGALANIQAKPLSLPLAPVRVLGNDYSDIENAINDDAVEGPGGLLVLPVDLFFGAVDYIHQWAKAKSLSVFWPVSDWVPPGVGSYGVAQETCGESMGKQVQYILENKKIPTGNQRFITLKATTRTWVASKAAAKALNIELQKHSGLRYV